MAFDLSQVLGQAQQVTEQASGDTGDGRKYPPIVYPGIGTLKVKLLFNPKANLVSRMIRRHKVQDVNHTCLRTYGQECPICKTLEAIKNSTGNDFWQFNDRARGLSYAQYVGSDGYNWGDREQPQVGELILLMYPWGVYQDINRVISSAGVNAAELIAKNEGKIINIIHSKVNGRDQYKAEVDAWQQFKSCADDAEFEKYLNDLPDLNDAITPKELTEDTRKDANDVAETLSREYLKGVDGSMSGGFNSNALSGNSQVINVNGQQYVNVNGQLLPIANTSSVAPATSIQNPAPIVNSTPPQDNSFPMNPPQSTPASQVTTADGQSMPECFGQHKDGDPKCMVCLHEPGCMVTA